MLLYPNEFIHSILAIAWHCALQCEAHEHTHKSSLAIHFVLSIDCEIYNQKVVPGASFSFDLCGKQSE